MQRTGRRLLTTVAQCVILIIVGASIRELCAQADLEPSLVKDALRMIAVEESERRHEGIDILSRMRCDAIAPALAHAIHTDDSYKDLDTRRAAFAVLAGCRGAFGAEATDLLLAGLLDDDIGIVRTVGRRLATCSEHTKAKAAAAFNVRWLREVAEKDAPPLYIIEVAGALGAAARPFTQDIAGVLVDEASQEQKRLASAKALLAISVDDALGSFQNASDSTRTIALWALGYLGSKTQGRFDGDSEHQQAIREFVVTMLDSSVLEVRQAAFESLAYVFGDAAVVFDSPSQYRLHPEMEGALEKLAKSETDEILRQRSAKALEQCRERLDRTAQEILGRREEGRSGAPSERIENP